MNPLGRYLPLVAVVVAAFLVGNLAYNVENLDWGEELEPPQGYSAPESGTSVSNSSSMSQALRYVFAGTIILLTCGSLVMIAGKAMNDKKGFLKSMGVYLLAGALVVGMFAIMAMSANPHGGTVTIPNPITGGEITIGGGGADTPAGAPNPLISVIVIVVLVFFAIAAAAAFIFLGKASKRMSLGRSKDEKRQEAAAVMARAREELAVGGDYRVAVLRCYRDMVKLLAGKGVRDEEHLTAREFEALASTELELGSELRELTALFEEARYSHHDVAEGQRERAAKAFERVRGALLARSEEGAAQAMAKPAEVTGDGV